MGFQHGTSFLKQRHAPINDDLAHPALKVHWPNSVNRDNSDNSVNSDNRDNSDNSDNSDNRDNRYC